MNLSASIETFVKRLGSQSARIGTFYWRSFWTSLAQAPSDFCALVFVGVEVKILRAILTAKMSPP